MSPLFEVGNQEQRKGIPANTGNSLICMEDVILHSNFFFISFVNLFYSLDEWVQFEPFNSSLFSPFLLLRK